jgi:hypothetical protein
LGGRQSVAPFAVPERANSGPAGGFRSRPEARQEIRTTSGYAGLSVTLESPQNAAVRRGLVEIVRDFLAVHQQFTLLFERFRSGTLRFDDVRGLVADSESSPLFRLKERVHALFRGDIDGGQPLQGEALRRGEALFDLAVGSLFHEALKFRENFYQLEVYAPRVLSLRDEGGGEADELLREFEKILRGASKRVDESLDEAETLLHQMRRQLLVLLVDSREEKSVGLVTRYLIGHRAEVEGVYAEGLEALLAKLHEDVLSAYLCGVRSQLESARFDEAIAMIREALAVAASGDRGTSGDARAELEQLDAYARGMDAFLQADYAESVKKLEVWLDCVGEGADPTDLDFARAALSRIPELVDSANDEGTSAAATRLMARLSGFERSGA